MGLEVSTDSIYSFTAANAGLYTSKFCIKKYTVSATSVPIEAGTLTGTGIYEHGKMVNLIAFQRLVGNLITGRKGIRFIQLIPVIRSLY